MSTLLQEIFLNYVLYSDRPPSKEYREKLMPLSKLHNQVEQTLGIDFSERLWHAHSQLSQTEIPEAFHFGLRLARELLLY